MYGLNSTIDKQARREENDFLNFYSKHSISPVRQDLSNKEVHYRRREKLYRQLGMPVILFKDANMLEVGPGGGYNTLAFFEWNIRHIDLVEANPKGIEDMKELFNGINKDKYSVHACLIEEYKNNSKYDIVIAESFLQFLKNQKEVIDILKEKVVDGGVVVITCSDEVCFFIEQIKRLLAHAYVKDIDNYEKKVEILAEYDVNIHIVAVSASERLKETADSNKRIDIRIREFRDSDINGMDFVVAATGNRELDMNISKLCKKQRIPVNVVDIKEACSFIFPAVIYKEPLLVTVSSGGASPALVAKIKRDISQVIPDYYASMAERLAEIREYIIGSTDNIKIRKQIFEKLVQYGSTHNGVIPEREVEQVIEELRLQKVEQAGK